MLQFGCERLPSGCEAVRSPRQPSAQRRIGVPRCDRLAGPGCGSRDRLFARVDGVNEALRALLARHRSAEVEASYAAYDDHPLDEPDEWGDLASFREAAGRS